LEEVDEKFIDYITPKKETVVASKFINKDIFGTPDKQKIRFKKPISRAVEKNSKKPDMKPINVMPPKNLKKVSDMGGSQNLFDNNLVQGNIVEHAKFGRGDVVSVEGTGTSKKAEIRFESGDTKKLLLQFAKLKIIG
jgi:DNA helicase-2/ATP-dependent DNA helicase PcrA